jgi:hypothetical protein
VVVITVLVCALRRWSAQTKWREQEDETLVYMWPCLTAIDYKCFTLHLGYCSNWYSRGCYDSFERNMLLAANSMTAATSLAEIELSHLIRSLHEIDRELFPICDSLCLNRWGAYNSVCCINSAPINGSIPIRNAWRGMEIDTGDSHLCPWSTSDSSNLWSKDTTPFPMRGCCHRTCWITLWNVVCDNGNAIGKNRSLVQCNREIVGEVSSNRENKGHERSIGP